MPPQSRGSSNGSAAFIDADRGPPTLRPYLENLPAPTALIPDQLTPTRRNAVDRDVATPTPSRPQPTALSNTAEEEEEVDDVTLDDEEFESHYSRRDSPASSDATSNSEDGSEIEYTPATTSTTTSTNIQRVTSLPVTSSHHHNLHATQSTHSLRLPPIPPPPLYPPFYNRPPTPLPPSPSLTSLLRPPSLLNITHPSRSTASTRPTTPDSSDIETPLDTEAAVAHSARRANIVPAASPEVPTYEYYGFVLYLASTLTFIGYLLWSYLPSAFLHAVGITYYPDRWWSLAIPSWIVVLLVFVYVAVGCYNVEYLTLGLEELGCMVDEAGNVAVLDEAGRVRRGGSKGLEREREVMRKGKGVEGGSVRGKRKGRKREKERGREEDWFRGWDKERNMQGLAWRQIWNEGTDAVMDVPIGGVCEVLYGEG